MSSTKHTNAITGLAIKANNVTALDQMMQQRRFAEPKWATFQQWKGTGAPVRPGEAGVTLEGASGFKWRVFNVAQTQGGKAEAARAPAAIAPRPPVAAARKVEPSPRAPDLSVLKNVARSATAVKSGTVTIDAVALREALEWTRRAVSTEETRYYLNGVYFAPVATGELQLVATDGHRMHGQSLPCKWTGGKVGPGFIVKPETIRALLKEIGGKPREVAVTVKSAASGPAALAFKVHGGATVVAKAIDGTFPDFARVIPQDRLPPFSLQARAVFEAADLAADGVKPGKATKAKRAATVAVALDAAGVHLKATARPYAYFNPKYLRDMARMGDVLDVEFAKGGSYDSPTVILVPSLNRWGVLMPTRGDAPASKPAVIEATAEPVTVEPVTVEPVTVAPVETVLAEATAAEIETSTAEITVTVEPAPVAPPRTWLQRLRAIFGRR